MRILLVGLVDSIGLTGFLVSFEYRLRVSRRFSAEKSKIETHSTTIIVITKIRMIVFFNVASRSCTKGVRGIWGSDGGDKVKAPGSNPTTIKGGGMWESR